MQGYYFSKPLLPEDFDVFLAERAKIKYEATSVTRKTYMSISKALTSSFESIYYVDVATDIYLEFFTGADGDLEIRPGGTDFFKDAREKLLEGVLEADVQKLREATSKTNLIHLAEQEESIQLSFSRQKNGVPVPYFLQTIRTRESDDHHLIIGVRQERDDGDERA